MTELVRYEAARAALAEARKVDEVLAVRDGAERLKLYARQAKERDMMADAVEIRLRAERKLGEIIKAAKDVGQISRGQPPKNCNGEEQFSRVKLEEAGIDRKLSSTAQKRASIAEQAFERMVQATRERIISDRAKIIDAPLAHGASRVQGADDLDYSPTPPWATRALMEHVLPRLDVQMGGVVREPACGEGHMAEVLREYCRIVVATDIHDYGYGDLVLDFLAADEPLECDWVVTNPPFEDRVIKFIVRALEVARVGVCMFLQLRYLEGIGRYEKIYRPRPPTLIAPFVERVPLLMGQYDPRASTTTAFMWLVWLNGVEPRAPFWIPPGRREALTERDDAECFTAHPVIKRPRDAAGTIIPHDAGTGEVMECAQ